MIQNRLQDKEKDVRGMQRATADMLKRAWEKGYAAGFDDGYATRREAEKEADNG